MTGPLPSSLRAGLADYLALRRALGYRLARPEKLLGQFLDHLEQAGEARITVAAALDWARLPAGGGDSNWWAYRLSAVRGFATYLHSLDPAHEVPAAELLPQRPHRASPWPANCRNMSRVAERRRTIGGAPYLRRGAGAPDPRPWCVVRLLLEAARPAEARAGAPARHGRDSGEERLARLPQMMGTRS